MYRTSATFDCIANASTFAHEAERITGRKVLAELRGAKIIVCVQDNVASEDAIKKLANESAGLLGTWDDSTIPIGQEPYLFSDPHDL